MSDYGISRKGELSKSYGSNSDLETKTFYVRKTKKHNSDLGPVRVLHLEDPKDGDSTTRVGVLEGEIDIEGLERAIKERLPLDFGIRNGWVTEIRTPRGEKIFPIRSWREAYEMSSKRK